MVRENIIEPWINESSSIKAKLPKFRKPKPAFEACAKCRENKMNLLLSKIDSDFKIISTKSEISKYIKKVGCKINITMGAGDISNEVEKIKEELAYEI